MAIPIKFGNDSSMQIQVTDSVVVNVEEALSGDSNFAGLKNGERVVIQPDATVRVSFTGNQPTTTRGFKITAGNAVSELCDPEKVNIIAESGTANVEIMICTVIPGIN